MATFDIMIPFILHCEEGIPPRELTKPPEEIYRSLGERAHLDPADSGGWTKAGVTLATYASWRKRKGIAATTVDDLRRMPYAHWRAILKEMFWDRLKADLIADTMVAVACVDWAWGSGSNGIKGVQRVVGVTPDGIVGAQTLAAINSRPDQRSLFAEIQAARDAYHARIARPGTKNAKFLRGWNARVAKITYNGFKYK